MTCFDRNEAVGIAASSRWSSSVSDDPAGRRLDQRSCTPAGVQESFLNANPEGAAALNHRLLALISPASSC